MANAGINPIGSVLDRFGLHTLLGFPTNPTQATGVGGQLNLFYFRLDKPGLFAAVLTVSVLSILFFGLMVLLERVLVPWQKSQ